MSGLLWRVVGWACPGAQARSDGTADDPRQAALLLRACVLVRTGALEEAEQLLESGLIEEEEPARLNLVGVLCEKRGQWAAARRQYGRAIRAARRAGTRSAEAARQNLRRWFELDTFGRTKLRLRLGDEEPGMWWLRRCAVAERADGQSRIEIGAAHHDN